MSEYDKQSRSTKPAIKTEPRYRILHRSTADVKYPVPALEDITIRKYIKLIQDYGLDHNMRSYTSRNLVARMEDLERCNSPINTKALQQCFKTGNYHVGTGNTLYSLRSEFHHLKTVLSDIIDSGGHGVLVSLLE